ncbi:hypothetical protein ETI10_13620, partial [Macrococcoides goetzii]
MKWTSPRLHSGSDSSGSLRRMSMTRVSGKIAGHFGAFFGCNLSLNNRYNSYVRFQVEIAVIAPLFLGVFVDREDKPPLWIQAKYENLGLMCFRCWCLGHESVECSRDEARMIHKQGVPEVAM